MKLSSKIIAAAMALMGAVPAFAQDCDIEIAIANITKGEVVPAAVNSRLEGKLVGALSRAGIVAAPYDAQFFIAGRFDDAFNDITSGPSQKVAVKTTLTLFIGDADNQKIFASETFELKGVGSSDTQAYTNAMSRLNASNTQLVEFLRKGKDKIVEYFDNNYTKYLNDAQKAVAQRDFGQALYYANQIPACSRGYAEANALAMNIYSQSMNHDAQKLLQQAKAAWAADPTETGAAEAHRYLSQIDPQASCRAEADALSSQISKTTQKQWEFENVTKYNNAVALEKQRINAAKEVAVAWAKNRPKTVNRYVFIHSRY